MVVQEPMVFPLLHHQGEVELEFQAKDSLARELARELALQPARRWVPGCSR